MRSTFANLRAFSLIELVIVLAIVSVLGAIAVPRLSSVAGDAPMAAFKADLVTIQNAVERYTAEHVGLMPDKDVFAQQLSQYTDIHGNISPVKSATHIYGPYLRKMPEVYVGPRVNAGDIVESEMSDGTAVGEVALKSMETNTATAWMYNPATGKVRVRLAP